MNLFSTYSILGVTPISTDAEIKDAHRRLSRQYHPDRGGDVSKFHEVQEAYRLIRSTADRRALLVRLSGLGSPCHACGGRGYHRKTKSFTVSTTTPCAACGSCGMIPNK